MLTSFINASGGETITLLACMHNYSMLIEPFTFCEERDFQAIVYRRRKIDTMSVHDYWAATFSVT